MVGARTLDVVIGLFFIYLSLSLICSALTEWIAAGIELRARNLRAWIGNILGDPNASGFVRQLYAHPMIKSLYRRSWLAGSPRNSLLIRRTALVLRSG